MSDTPIPSEPPKTSGKTEFWKTKVGPLSIGWYLVAFIVMLAVWYWWRSRKTTALTPTTFTGDGIGTHNTMGAASGGNSSTGQGGYAGAVTGPTGGSPATSLAQWAENASNYLIGVGNTPANVEAALSAYTAGQPLNSQEQALINAALSAEGSPPSGVVAPNTSSSSVAYTVQGGDTLTSIAQMFYGDTSRWHDLYANNMNVFGPNVNLSTPLHAGETIIVPGTGLLPQPGPRDVYSGVPTGNKYTLQFGDSLIQLAERFYGDGSKWTAIAAANPKLIPDPNHPPIGTVITIPNTVPSIGGVPPRNAIGL